MQTIEYLDLVNKEIKNYFLDESHDEVDLEIIQVWYCKTIQNHKGLFIVHDKDTHTHFFMSLKKDAPYAVRPVLTIKTVLWGEQNIQ